MFAQVFGLTKLGAAGAAGAGGGAAAVTAEAGLTAGVGTGKVAVAVAGVVAGADPGDAVGAGVDVCVAVAVAARGGAVLATLAAGCTSPVTAASGVLTQSGSGEPSDVSSHMFDHLSRAPADLLPRLGVLTG